MAQHARNNPEKYDRIEDIGSGIFSSEDRREYTLPDLSELTCFKCPQRTQCEFVDDPYNTDGDCLAEK